MRKRNFVRGIILVLVCGGFIGSVCDPDTPPPLPDCTFTQSKATGFSLVELKFPTCCEIAGVNTFVGPLEDEQGKPYLFLLSQVRELADHIGDKRMEMKWSVKADGCSDSTSSYTSVFYGYETCLSANSLGEQPYVDGVPFNNQKVDFTIQIFNCINMDTGEIGTLLWKYTNSFLNGSFLGLNMGNNIAEFEANDFKMSGSIFVHDQYVEFY